MPRLLALEWNDTEARLAVAATRGDRVVFEQAFSVDLRPSSAEVPATNVGERIATAMAARSVGRLDTLVAIGRSSIELRQFSLPPAPDEDLPELVRFQAMREFNALDESWLLDFVPIDEAPDQPRNVLAAAIGPDLVDQIQAACQTAGLKPRRLILRPCAAASLVCRALAGSPIEVRLLVDLLEDEADLTVMVDRKVIFLRTARLPGNPLTDADAAGALLGQIRRTMAAVQNQLDARRVTCVVLCGTGPDHAALAEMLHAQLAIPTELFDPFEGIERAGELTHALPDHPGRFAPLLGMLLDELEQVAPAVDFFHPRKTPEPPSRRNTFILAGGAIAVLVAAFFFARWYQRTLLIADVVSLRNQVKELNAELAKVQKDVKVVDTISDWMATDVIWLDELRRLAEKLPPAKEVLIVDLGAGPAAPQGGEIKLDGFAQSATTIDRLEEQLRDENHTVVGSGRSEDKSQRYYSWKFDSSLFVPPEQP